MRSRFILLFGILLFSVLTEKTLYAQKKSKDKLLANKIYAAKFTEQGDRKNATIADWDITFRSDNITSVLLREVVGYATFLPPSYTATIDSSSATKKITFAAESTNSDKDVLKWSGTVIDKTIEGTATLERKGEIKRQYSFLGTLREPKKK